MLQISLQFLQKGALIMDVEGCGSQVSHSHNPEDVPSSVISEEL